MRGKKGVKYFQKDKFNRIIGSYNNGSYDSLLIPAKNIGITLDIDLQVYGDSLMKNKFGSIIAIEPKSGEILALVNSPGYDPSMPLIPALEVKYDYFKPLGSTSDKVMVKSGIIEIADLNLNVELGYIMNNVCDTYWKLNLFYPLN